MNRHTPQQLADLAAVRNSRVAVQRNLVDLTVDDVKEKQFRCNARKFLLTWPKMGESKEEVMRWLIREKGAFKAVVSEEKHADGSPHVHAFVQYSNKKNVVSASYFNYKGYQCNIQAARDADASIRYVKKDGNFCSNTEKFDVDSIPIGKKRKFYEDFEWEKQYKEQKSLVGITWPIKIKDKHGFIHVMEKPDPAKKQRSWWIVGKPNAGKTYWLNETFAGMKIYALTKTKTPYERYDDEELIVYDDAIPSFAECANVLNTWRIQMPVFGNVRYTNKLWPLGSTRNMIVLKNHGMDTYYKETLDAMRARFVEIHVDEFTGIEENLGCEEEISDWGTAALKRGYDYAKGCQESVDLLRAEYINDNNSGTGWRLNQQ